MGEPEATGAVQSGESLSRGSLTPQQQVFLDEETKRCVETVGSWLPVDDAECVCKAFLVPKLGVSTNGD